MTRMLLVCAAALGMCVSAEIAMAAPLPGIMTPDVPAAAALAQSPQSGRFRRCMRSHYGPRYFARVPRAHRWHMSQVCMG
jgi:hypothetical protein